MDDRVFCEHAHECAGCPLIDRPYAAQLGVKLERVRAAAAPYSSLAALEVEPTVAAEPIVRYRTRAKLMVGARTDGAPSIGLFARTVAGEDGHRVVDIPGCRVLGPALNEVAAGLRALLASAPASAGGCLVPEASGGLLSALDLREVVGEGVGVLVTLVLSSRGAPPEHELRDAARAVREVTPVIVGVAVNYREPRAVQVLGATTRPLLGPAVVRDRIGDAYRLATYGAFTQAHRGQAARIDEWITSLVSPSETHVLDLFGGSGALSLPLAQRGARVTLVESFAPAAECAAQAANEQHVSGFTVRKGDAATIASELAKSSARFDLVIANPPRRGLSPALRIAISALSPRLVAYVSCDPDTLCRDLDHLARLGYRADGLRPLDMIPLTDQVETVAFLRPAPRSNPRPVFEDDDIFVIDTRAHDPPLAPSAALGEARVLRGVARGASGLVIGCKSASVEEGVRAALGHAGASRTELVLCRGVTAREGVVARRTQYRRIARVSGHSLLRVTVRGDGEARIESDLARIGHPVIGDTRRGHAPTNRHFEERYALDRPFMHCLKVEFDHPRASGRVVAMGALPGELAMVLGRLGLVALDVAKEVMVG